MLEKNSNLETINNLSSEFPDTIKRIWDNSHKNLYIIETLQDPDKIELSLVEPQVIKNYITNNDRWKIPSDLIRYILNQIKKCSDNQRLLIYLNHNTGEYSSGVLFK